MERDIILRSLGYESYNNVTNLSSGDNAMTSETVRDGQRSITTDTSLSLHEVIGMRLMDLDDMYRECGDWTGEEYAEMCKPLHQALLNLSANLPEKDLTITDPGV